MQCCAAVQATCRKQQTPQLWIDETGEGCGFFCSLMLPFCGTMSQQFCYRLKKDMNSFPPPLESFLSLWFQKALKMKGLIELDVSWCFCCKHATFNFLRELFSFQLSLRFIRALTQKCRRWLRKRHIKIEYSLLQNLSRFVRLVQFVSITSRDKPTRVKGQQWWKLLRPFARSGATKKPCFARVSARYAFFNETTVIVIFGF